MSTRYSIDMEGDRVVSVVVDGVRYDRPEDVPDPEDRRKVYALLAAPPADEPTGPATGPPVEKIVAGVFAAVTVILLAVAVATGVSAAQAVAREQAAPGRVVSLTPRTVDVPRDSSDRSKGTIQREYFYPVVEFDLPDGTRKTVQTAEGSWPPAYEAGDEVTVRYDPARPTDARIASGSGTLMMWTWTIVTGGLGLAFGFFTVLVYRVFIRPARSTRPEI